MKMSSTGTVQATYLILQPAVQTVIDGSNNTRYTLLILLLLYSYDFVITYEDLTQFLLF